MAGARQPVLRPRSMPADPADGASNGRLVDGPPDRARAGDGLATRSAIFLVRKCCHWFRDRSSLKAAERRKDAITPSRSVHSGGKDNREQISGKPRLLWHPHNLMPSAVLLSIRFWELPHPVRAFRRQCPYAAARRSVHAIVQPCLDQSRLRYSPVIHLPAGATTALPPHVARSRVKR